MKKIITLTGLLLIGLSIHAQDISDAVRYSNTSLQGSSRFRAMSGAFGALGGDLSAINVNPASSAVFSNSYSSFTLSLNSKKNTTSYFGNSNNNKDSNIDLSQAGAVFLFRNNNSESKWKKFTLALAYDQFNSYSDNWLASGINQNNTIGDYFLNNAQGLRLDQISALAGESTFDAYNGIGNAYGFENQQAFLGYDSYILEPDTFNDDNINYSNNISGGNYTQQHKYNSTGYNGKLAFNFGTQYTDDIYFGLNLNSHFLNYERTTFLFEKNTNTSSVVKEVAFENTLRAEGAGFSFQLGTIVKLEKNLRAGLSYESPTWYTIEEETTQYLETLRDDAGTNAIQITDPNSVNLFPKYTLQTPGKVTGSLAYVFGKKGLISFDYGIKDYSKTKFKPKNDSYFSAQNRIIEDNLALSSNYSLGGEYKIKALSLRAGYRFEASPYKDKTIMDDLTGYSLGLGYSFGNTKLDLAYAASKQERNHNLYSTGLTDAANIDSKNSNITLTLGFNL